MKFSQYLWDSAADPTFRRNSNRTLNGPEKGSEASYCCWTELAK